MRSVCEDLVADHVLDRADEPDLRAQRLFQHMLQKIGDGRFAVRAGDADDAHIVCRMSKPVRTEHCKRCAGIRNQHIGNLHLRLFLADDAGCAVFCSLRNILWPSV